MNLADVQAEMARKQAARPKGRPVTYKYPELGRALPVSGYDEATQRILNRWPAVTGEIVAGSDDTHRSYWFQARVVAHVWRTKSGTSLLRMLSA